MPMRMDISQYQRLEMKMRLAPQIIQSIEILQLPTLELQQRINQELMENPVLDQLEPGVEDAAPAETEDERTSDESEFDKMEEMEERIRDYSSQAPARPRAGDRDPKLEAMQNTAAPSLSLQEYLAGQLTMLELDPETRRIAENIVFNLDDNGYLQYSLEEILESMPPGTTVQEAERVLSIVQTLDPPGIAAREIQECLLLQLSEDEVEYDLERLLITKYLDDLRMNRYPKIVKETGRTLDEIRQAAQVICHLSPRPGAVFSTEQPQYVLPDIRVEQANGEGYRVVMCDDYVPRLRISRDYMNILRSPTSTTEEKEYIKKKLQSAKWLIDSIEQRRGTLRRIVEGLVKEQREFFDRGVRFLKPLRMGVIAKAAGVHVSTVSRAIADKYVETPRGLFPIRFFFAGSAQAESEGAGDSRVSVQERVRELIDNEDKRKPISDVDILKTLKNDGIDVARRTVTKYRRLMSIPPAKQRMQY